MYTVGSTLPIAGIDPGSTLLVVGPPMTGKRDLVTELLAHGLPEDGVAVISTDESAGDIRESLAACGGGGELPLGVIDCVGDSHGTEGQGPLDSRVSSPADLTGVGMKLTGLLEQLYADHAYTLRVGLVSLTTMSMYATPEQVVRFLHTVTSRITDADAVGFVVAHSDTVEKEHLRRLRSLVDGVVEVREAAEGSELRVRGLAGADTDWTPFERDRRPTPPGERESYERAVDVPVADSLRSIFDDVRADAPTLTVCNYEGPEEELNVVRRYFDRQGVKVREATLDVDQPHSVALLHHGDDLLGSESVTTLRSAVDLAEEGVTERRRSDLVTDLEQSVFGAAAADKGLLIDVSHSIELLANRNGTGRLHAGFQELSNLVDNEQAARIYERLSDSGVDVHVYGTPDAETTLPGVSVHPEDCEEIHDSWFVTYDGAGDPRRQATLLAIEHETGGKFKGFWTYDSDIVEQVDSYLTATYLEN